MCDASSRDIRAESPRPIKWLEKDLDKGIIWHGGALPAGVLHVWDPARTSGRGEASGGDRSKSV